MSSLIRVVAISGSLRKASTNTGLLRYMQKIGPDYNMDISIANLQDIPLYNQDEDPTGSEKQYTPAIQKLRDQVEGADAVLFATPEYNYSVSPVLTNAIAWLSRGTGEKPQVLKGKKAFVVGSGGGVGTCRAQYHLRQMFVFLKVTAIPDECCVRRFSGNIFDKNGDVTDGDTQQKLKDYMSAFQKWY